MTSVSVVTPTYLRPSEVVDLLVDLSKQTVPIQEAIVVDGAPSDDDRTEDAIRGIEGSLPFPVRYLRTANGTAVQRNAGIDVAQGDVVAFVDDDVRLDPPFLDVCVAVLEADDSIGGVVGYRENVSISFETTPRWRWYRRLRLLSTYEPGRYDRRCGYPINNNLQPRFHGIRDVDFMTTACAVWRRAVFDCGLRFDPWFRDYGVLEDAHFSLRAGRVWRLVQAGDATCRELHAAGGRPDGYRRGFKSIVNYYYVFRSIEGPLSFAQRARFWRFQVFEFVRVLASAARRRRRYDVDELRGRVAGIGAVLRGAAR